MSLARLIALLAALTLAVVPVACGGDSGGGAGGGASAADVLEQAGKNTAKSADVKLRAGGLAEGLRRASMGPVKFSLEGPYRSNGAKTLPDLDWRMHAEGDGQKFDARLITTRDNAWVEYEGKTYEVGEQLVSQLTSQLKQPAVQPAAAGLSSTSRGGSRTPRWRTRRPAAYPRTECPATWTSARCWSRSTR